MSVSQLESARAERLDYIQGMLDQLRKMSSTDGHDMLAYLIEMAFIEASDLARETRPLIMKLGNADRPR